MTASYLSGLASGDQDRTQSTSLAGVAVGDWLVIWTGRRSLPELDQTVADPALTDVTIDGSWVKLGEQTSWRDGRLRDLYAAAFAAKVATVGATPSASVTWSAADGDGFVAVLAWRVAGVDKVVGSGLAGVNNTDGPLDLTLTAASGESLGSGDDVVAIGAKDGDSALTEPAEFTTSEQIFSTGNLRAASGTYAGDSSAALTFEGSGGRGLNLMGFAFAEDSAPPPPPPPAPPPAAPPSGRRTVTLVELHQKVCSRVYGTAPCTAEVGVTGAQRCFNTRATCQDLDNFDQTTKTLRLAEPVEGIPLEWNAVPSLKSVSIKGARINYAGLTNNSSPLGVRGAATIDIQDHPDGDSMADPYLATRLYDPVKRGTAWGKWLARHRDWQDLGVDIITARLDVAPVYSDTFDSDRLAEWYRGLDSVDGTLAMTGGKLVYTKGAGDGAQPRVVVRVPVDPGERYAASIPAPTGTADRKELWVSTARNGGFFEAVTSVVNNAALDEEFTSPVGAVYIVVRAGTDSTTGETVEIDSAAITPVAFTKRRSYFLEEVKGPSAGGAVSLTVRDILSRADGGRAKAPRTTDGTLAATINASATSLLIAAANPADIQSVGAAYVQKSTGLGGLVKIGREVIRFSSVTSGPDPDNTRQLNSLERGVYGTTAAEHTAGAGIQAGIEFVDQKPWAILKELFSQFGGIPLAWIPEDEWEAEHDRWLLPYDQLSGAIVEPSDLDDMIAEVCEAVMLYIWVDPVAQKIRLRAARPVEEEVIDLSDLGDILADSQGRDIRITEQVSRGDVFFNVVDYSEKVDEGRNYRNIRSVVGDQFGLPRIRQILTRWLKTDAQATQTARTMLLASNVLPIYATVTVGAKDVERLGPGSIVRLNTRILQDATGATEPALFLVVEAQEAGASKMRLTMRTIGNFPTASVYTDDVVGEYSTATTEEREENSFYTDDDGKIDAVTVPYFYI